MVTARLKQGIRPVLGVALLVTALLLTQQSALAGQTLIQVGDIFFCDESLQGGVCETTIGVGETIVWDFDGANLPHTTTECGASCDEPTDSPLWDSGLIGDESTFDITFNEPGTFLYYCQVHPTLQRGIIIVEGGGSTVTPEASTPTTVPPTSTLPPPTPTPTPTSVPPSPTPAGVTGDVNCNGSVDSIDAALVLQLTAGLVDSLSCQENADTNEDGTTNSIDAALILQLTAGLLSNLPP